MDELTQKFMGYRTGDIVLSSGENIGDLIIFFGRHSTIQHSCILVWLDVKAMRNHKVKVVSHYVDDETTQLSFLGLAEGARTDMVTGDKRKGLILWEPEELMLNAPIVYVRELSKEYISDEYVVRKMTEYIQEQHLKMQYAYGKGHIVTVGLGFDVFGEHPKGGKLCSENIYHFLEKLCEYPEFKIDGKKVLHPKYSLPDAISRMTVPDFFASSNNSHPVFEPEEYRVISKKSEEDVTVHHPYFLVFVLLVVIIVFAFLLINNYCESCRANPLCQKDGVCMMRPDFFDTVF